MDDGIARMGEVVFSAPDRPSLRALGLGSCIGLCAFDPVSKLACIAHVMLPQAKSSDTQEIGKYADTAVPYVIEQMASRGASKSQLRFAIAGGAQLFSFEGSESSFDVGKRNIAAVKQSLGQIRARLVAEDVGGRLGRTITLDANTGKVTVKLVGGKETVLTNLAS